MCVLRRCLCSAVLQMLTQAQKGSTCKYKYVGCTAVARSPAVVKLHYTLQKALKYKLTPYQASSARHAYNGLIGNVT